MLFDIMLMVKNNTYDKETIVLTKGEVYVKEKTYNTKKYN